MVSICFGSTFRTLRHLSTGICGASTKFFLRVSADIAWYRRGSCKLSDLVISPISPQRMFWVTRLQIGDALTIFDQFLPGSQCPSSIHQWNPPVPACTCQIHHYKLRGYSGGRIFDVWHAAELQTGPEHRCCFFLGDFLRLWPNQGY